MSHKLIYALTDQRRLAIDDFLERTLPPNQRMSRQKYLIEQMKQQALMVSEWIDDKKVILADGNIREFDPDKALAFPLPKEKVIYEGEKAALEIGPELHRNLTNMCRIDNHLRTQDSKPPISFNAWVNELVNMFAKICIRANNKAKLDAEDVAETPIKSKPKE